MTQGFEHNIEHNIEHNTDGTAPENMPQPPNTTRAALTPLPRLAVVRNTPRDTWDWLWKDTLVRVVPLGAAAIFYRRFFTEERRLGYSSEELGRELLLGAAVGVPLAAITAAFRAWVAPGYRLPTAADQAFQTTFYLALNAPAEELFWRGTVQHVTVRLLRLAPPLRRLAVPLGWAFATATYASYHRLGGWSWRTIAGVAFAGTIFGALFQSRPRERAMVAVTLAHGLTTAAFLSWGDVALHHLARYRLHRRVRDTLLEEQRKAGEQVLRDVEGQRQAGDHGDIEH